MGDSNGATNPTDKNYISVESIDFELDLKSDYKPVDELFDSIMDDDGYQDIVYTRLDI